MRLFAAVLPPADVLEHLEHALELVRGGAGPSEETPALRWTPPEDRHLTVAFFGAVPDGYLDDVSDALADVAGRTNPFDLMLRGAGVFDGRTLWIGCAGDTGALGRLTREAVAVGQDLLGRPDDRVRSRAHLTVARVGSRARGRSRGWSAARRGQRGSDAAGQEAAGVGSLARALAVYRGPTWRVEDIALVASDLGAGPSGSARHDVLRRFALTSVAG